MHAQSIKKTTQWRITFEQMLLPPWRRQAGEEAREEGTPSASSHLSRGLWEEPQRDDSSIRRLLRLQTDSRTKSPLRPVEELV